MKAAAVLLLALAGCASLPDDLAPARDSWRGAGFDEVMKAWGPPARSEAGSGGTMAYTWVSESYRRTGPGGGVVFGTGGAAIGARLPFGNAGDAVRCDRTMELREGAVVGGRWLGPYDYCSTFRR